MNENGFPVNFKKPICWTMEQKMFEEIGATLKAADCFRWPGADPASRITQAIGYDRESETILVDPDRLMAFIKAMNPAQVDRPLRFAKLEKGKEVKPDAPGVSSILEKAAAVVSIPVVVRLNSYARAAIHDANRRAEAELRDAALGRSPLVIVALKDKNVPDAKPRAASEAVIENADHVFVYPRHLAALRNLRKCGYKWILRTDVGASFATSTEPGFNEKNCHIYIAGGCEWTGEGRAIDIAEEILPWLGKRLSIDAVLELAARLEAVKNDAIDAFSYGMKVMGALDLGKQKKEGE